VDAAGQPVPYGVPGELLVRGYLVTDGGCWLEPMATLAAVDSEGWMHTGDLDVLDADGYANILGRIKELIIRGGGACPPTLPDAHSPVNASESNLANAGQS
jgi:fatty-acyl-CoA synthase